MSLRPKSNELSSVSCAIQMPGLRYLIELDAVGSGDFPSDLCIKSGTNPSSS